MHQKKSVQQQNAVSEAAIRRHAVYWRSAVLPPALVEVASARGVDCARAIFLRLEVDFPGMPGLFGTLLTDDERFIEFSIGTSADHSTVVAVDDWANVTDRQNLDVHNRGIGVGAGALAVKVLRELNAAA